MLEKQAWIYLTTDKLMRIEDIMVNGCFVCRWEEDSCNYIMLLSPLLYKLWTMAYGFLDISWVMAGTVKDEI